MAAVCCLHRNKYTLMDYLCFRVKNVFPLLKLCSNLHFEHHHAADIRYRAELLLAATKGYVGEKVAV